VHAMAWQRIYFYAATPLIYFLYLNRCRQRLTIFQQITTWADPGFQVRGGALKKNCAERREARKNHIFSNFRWARAGCVPPWIRPWSIQVLMKTHYTLQVPLTEADIFPKSYHFNLPGNRENKFYSNNVWKKR
jgi:hypothetical protein